jgi:hypothetical protein
MGGGRNALGGRGHTFLDSYTLFDVSATPLELDTNNPGGPAGIAIFNDLGSGTVYSGPSDRPALHPQQ